MARIIVEGGVSLRGTVTVSGAKNAALPIMAATLLSDGPSVLKRVPDLRDIETMAEILRGLGVVTERMSDGTVHCEVRDPETVLAPYDLVSTMRGSICVLGPLLARRKRAKVSLPGGCVLGVRPIDLHLKGLRALGARIEIEHGYLVAEAEELRGAEIYLGGQFGSTVLGTANVLMAATLARGTTVIDYAACEPEIQDLGNFLVKMGAKIEGIGTPRLVVEGVTSLKGAEHSVIADRIEAGTFMVAAAVTRGDVLVDQCRGDHLTAVIDKLNDVGVRVERKNGTLRVNATGRLKATELTTHTYPGLPTDLQAQFMALLSVADGMSIVSEKIYPDRFMHAAELNRMGADIRKDGANAIVQGVSNLSGAEVMASDLRASAALVLAGLVARGKTEVHRVYHIDRGYERIERKLQDLGARIWREED
jgi:UDP-N-acetylglucosamine 1-carboxyvinyltransferase